MKIISGLVRLGLCNLEADLDNLGADVHSFGYGGTGKKSHQGDFVDYGASRLQDLDPKKSFK